MADFTAFSLLLIAVLSIFDVFKPAAAQDEDLEYFLLSLQDCVTRIERNAAPENPRYLEYLHDRLEGHMQIVVAISLVLDNLQGFQGLKDMLENLLQSLWELLQDIRNKITSCKIPCKIWYTGLGVAYSVRP